MTTIAYRDGILAADRLFTAGDIRSGLGSKIGRDGGYRWGMVGDRPGAISLFAWFKGGKPTKQPEREAGGSLIIIYDHGEGEVYSQGTSWPLAEAEFHAWGSGADIARGAMAMGASAEEAVQAAARFDVYTQGPFDVLPARAL